MKGELMDKEFISIVSAIALVLLTLITSVAWFNVSDRALMSKNISEAVAKGMDPLSVRCSYADSGDTICVAYAASTKK